VALDNNSSLITRLSCSVINIVVVVEQRYNGVLLHDTLPAPDCMDW